MKRPRPRALLLLAAAGCWASTQGCHELHVCYDEPCAPAHAGEGSFAGNAQSGAGTRRGAAGAAGVSSGGASQAGAGRGGLADGAGRGGRPPDGASGTEAALPAGAGGDESHGGEAGSNADAADAGNGGSADTAACVFPRADCDESAFTGCEANLLADIDNCGACRAHCTGACIDGSCSSFEILAEDLWLPARGGIALTSNEVYALGWVFGNTLIRWSAQQGAQTLFEGSGGFSELLLGVDRLYLFGGSDGLASIPLSGGTVASEGITARAGVVYDDTLYAVDDAGAPYSRSENGHEIGALPLLAPLPEFAEVLLAGDDFNAALVAEDGTGDAPAYTVYALDQSAPPAWVRVTSGTGNPAQVRVAYGAAYIDVVLASAAEAATSQLEHELREISFEGKTRVITNLTGLLDFELVKSRLFLSVELPEGKSVLRVLALDNPTSVLDVQTSAAMASLTYARPYFYFGDASRHRLARLPAWLDPF